MDDQFQASGQPSDVVIIGAGPAGLTAAYVLAHRYLVTATVIEADDVVGGLSRTVERDGWRFDIGGHRFFTKVRAVEELWHEILPGDDFLRRPRLSRILYRGQFYDYPLRATNALRNLGLVEALLCLGSYLRARLHPPKDLSTLEGWIVSRFGWRLYRHFFKSYNEKIWGVSADDLPADFAVQRIKSLSLLSAIANAMLPSRTDTEITSLVEEFHYPRLGPGMMWERCRERVEDGGSTVLTGTRLTRVDHDGRQVVAVEVEQPDGARRVLVADHLVSSMPIGELIEAFDPPAPAPVLDAAHRLRHRDFLTVAVVVDAALAFPDNWIYVHSSEVRVARIQNYGAWSPDLLRGERTCLGLEYFVDVGDDLWTSTDDELVELAKAELEQLELIDAGAVERGYVVRVPKAYPFYDTGYAANVDVLATWLAAHAANVHPVGRNGLHRYNNQDHSMLTAMLAAENIACGAHHDVWQVNTETTYHETRPPA